MDVRSDEELVLNVDEVFRHLDSYTSQLSAKKNLGEPDL